ncbi:hydrogenase maturation protease [Legionella spiritensis]|uniref:hydrogenase maturation protease n=1 Tax=Legionella spiritensis TaxID=452 RepID=UPI000F71F975|nr:hydrogenase maturation protease [Legionella spiritensis]VEG90227.1 hydrogenase expression/formation protein [Legionella spiritensis]
MSDLRVLGIGSPFGDDRLGWEAIALLQQQNTLKQYSSRQLQISHYDRPGLRLLELMQDAATVILIDAVKTGAAPGTCHRLENGNIGGFHNQLSSHNIGIAETIQLGHALNQLPKRMILYGIEIQEISSQFELSGVVASALNLLVLRIEKEIRGLLT